MLFTIVTRSFLLFSLLSVCSQILALYSSTLTSVLIVRLKSSALSILITRFSHGNTCCCLSNRMYWLIYLDRLWCCFRPCNSLEAMLCLCMVYKAWTMYKNDFASPVLRLLVRGRSASTLLSIKGL